EGDERVLAAERNAREPRLEHVLAADGSEQRTTAHVYSPSIRGPKAFSIARRFTFWVAVTSPSSCSSSLGSSAKRLICSTWARSAFTSATTSPIRSCTSGLLDRSA